nr:MAG TPA: hypothetical protein [Caudoviricetes sp.]
MMKEELCKSLQNKRAPINEAATSGRIVKKIIFILDGKEGFVKIWQQQVLKLKKPSFLFRRRVRRMFITQN